MSREDEISEAERIGQEVAALFFGTKPKRKRQRQKPHRCMRCGKVTRFIFCPDCNRERREEDRKEIS